MEKTKDKAKVTFVLTGGGKITHRTSAQKQMAVKLIEELKTTKISGTKQEVLYSVGTKKKGLRIDNQGPMHNMADHVNLALQTNTGNKKTSKNLAQVLVPREWGVIKAKHVKEAMILSLDKADVVKIVITRGKESVGRDNNTTENKTKKDRRKKKSKK